MSLAMVASHGLDDVRTIADDPLPEPQWRVLVDGAKRERLAGLLAAAVRAGAMPVTDGQLQEVADLEQRAAALSLRLEALLLEVADALDDAGIALRVLKGPAVAHTLYPDPMWRNFGDVDVLVAPEDFSRALQVLLDRGGSRRYPEPRPGFDRRFGKGAAIVTPDGWEIDLHRTFVAGPLGLRVDLPGLFATSTSFDLGGRELLGLGREEQFLNAAYHAALGARHPRLASLRDVAQFVLHGGLDDQRVLALAAAWRGEAAVARAVDLAWETLAVDEPGFLVSWARAHTPDRAAARELAAYVGEHRTYAGQALAGVRAVPGARNRLAYLWALAFPRRESRKRRNLTRWRRGASALANRPGEA